LFFLISGFLLYRPFVRARVLDDPAPRTGAYAWRRFLRIVPAYWVALAVIAIWLGLPGVSSVGNGVVLFLFGQTYAKDTIGAGIPQAWTLCIEVAFYAALPLFAALMARLPAAGGRSRYRNELIALAGLFLGSVAYQAIVVHAGLVNPLSAEPAPLLASLPGFADQFALGMGLAVLTVWLEDRPAPSPLRVVERRPGVLWLAGLGLFILVSVGIGLNDQPDQRYTALQYLLRHELYGLIALALLLPTVIGGHGRGLVRRVLAHRTVAWLGLVSYGIYLYHFVWLLQLRRWGFEGRFVDPWVTWTVTVAVGSIALAAASYYGIERFALRLKARVPLARAAEALEEPAPVAPPIRDS
jgi:peptidoglycan/LPS O-acetylase OafA/YrhL